MECEETPYAEEETYWLLLPTRRDSVSKRKMKYFPLLGVVILSTFTLLFNRKEKCADEVNVSAVALKPWPLPVTYGLVNIPGSGGSIINRILALKYERVCGKANSYNAYRQNDFQRQRDISGYLDGWGFSLPKYNPVLRQKMAKQKLAMERRNRKKRFELFDNTRHLSNIEFDDCDYVAIELPSKLLKKESKLWKENLHGLGGPVELHIPCRSPIDLLMSMCAYKKKEFLCDVPDRELNIQIHDCMSLLNKFSMDFSSDFTTKCFRSTARMDDYIEHMGKTLQKKRVQGVYFDRIPALWPHNKNTECIREKANENIKKKVRRMMTNYSYVKYCIECIGSENDLLINAS